MIQEATYVAAVAVFSVGAYCVLTKRNLVKICIGLSIMETAVILIVVAMAYRPDSSVPIIEAGIERYVDPLPHALALTAIVIGAGVTAIALSLTVLIYH